MQNKNISFLSIILATSLLTSIDVFAQEMPDLNKLDATMSASNQGPDGAGALSDFSQTDMSNKKTVDFPARSSMDSSEMAPLPGIFETNITGPQPMAESVSPNDLPSEQLIGRLTPEVFQEMAELERDKAFLKLQIEKETMKNNLEKLRSDYRRDRLDEIAKREEVIRSRIQWWQEQEKLRQEMERERAEAEEIRNQKAEAEAEKARRAGEAALLAQMPVTPAVENETEQEKEEVVPLPPPAILYTLVDVKGTRGHLTARVKNVETKEVSAVKVSDILNGEQVKNITLETVTLDRNGNDYVIKFPVEEAQPLPMAQDTLLVDE